MCYLNEFPSSRFTTRQSDGGDAQAALLIYSIVHLRGGLPSHHAHNPDSSWCPNFLDWRSTLGDQ